MKQPPSSAFPPPYLANFTAIEDPSLLNEKPPRKTFARRRKLLPLIAIAILLLLSGGALATFIFQKHLNVEPARLLPTDTIFYAELANYNNPSEDNSWKQLARHLRQFPYLADFNVNQFIAETLSFKDTFPSDQDIIIAVTSLPSLPQDLTVYSFAALQTFLAPSSTSAVAGATTIDKNEAAGFIAFIPLAGKINLAELLNQLLKDDSVTIEPLATNRTFRIKSNSENGPQPQEYFALLTGKYLALTSRQDDINRLAANYSLINSINPPESFYDSPSFTSLAAKRSKHSLINYVANLKAAHESLPDNITGQVNVLADGISVTNSYPAPATKQPPAPTQNQAKLLALLPEKLSNHFVSLYHEQSLQFPAKNICDTPHPSLNLNRFCTEGVLGLTALELEPLLARANHLAVLVAPRYDGKSPHAAIILTSDDEEATLYQNAENTFAALEKYYARQVESMREKPGISNPSVDTLKLSPLQLQILMVPTVNRQTTDHFGKTIISLQSTLATLPAEPSFTVIDNHLIITLDPATAREILDSFRGFNPNPSLLNNGSVKFQLANHPESFHSLTYLFPRGLSGIIRWIGSSYLPPGNNPETDAMIELLDSHLLVTRTIGSTTTYSVEEITQQAFIQITPLPKQQKQRALQMIRQFKP